MPSTSLYPARQIGRPQPRPELVRPVGDASDEDLADETLPAPLSDMPTTTGGVGLLDAALGCAEHLQWDESSWHLHRYAQQLLREPAGADHLDDLLHLASQTTRLRRCMDRAANVDVALARRVGGLARDLCYEVVCLLGQVVDVGHRMAMLLSVAHLLDTLGDASDAQAMRDQAILGLRTLCRPRWARPDSAPDDAVHGRTAMRFARAAVVSGAL
ncbi:MAG: hypothetical protein RLZZ584_1585 [Pseudomonadota bacterium]